MEQEQRQATQFVLQSLPHEAENVPPLQGRSTQLQSVQQRTQTIAVWTAQLWPKRRTHVVDSSADVAADYAVDERPTAKHEALGAQRPSSDAEDAHEKFGERLSGDGQSADEFATAAYYSPTASLAGNAAKYELASAEFAGEEAFGGFCVD